jgi:PAS domain S-box-containing protein
MGTSMREKSSRLFRSAVPFIAVAAVAGLRLSLDPFLGQRTPLAFFVFAIFISARYCGLGSGLIATLLSVLVGDYLFVTPRYSMRLAESGDIVSIVVLAVAGVAVSILCAQLRTALNRSLEEERQLRLISNSVPQFLWTATPDGARDFVNDRFYEYTGAEPGGGLGMNWKTSVHPDDLPDVSRHWANQTPCGDGNRCEYRIRRHDGIYRWFVCRAVAVHDASGRVVRWFGSNTDIQQTRERREAARAESERFRLIVATAPGAICHFAKHPDGSLSMPFASPSIRDICGIEHAEVAKNALPVLERVHPDDRERIQQTAAESARAMAVWHQGFRVRHPERGELWIEARAAPVREPEGTISWYGFLSDVTTQERAEAALRLQTDQELTILHTFVERAPMGIAMFDRRMRTIQASQRWLDDYGLTRAGAIGKSQYELFPKMPEHWKEAHRRGLAGESLSGYQDRFIGPDEKEHWASWEIAPWGDSGERTGGIIIVAEDVTGRIRAERDALRWQRAFHQSESGITLADPATDTIVAANPAAARLLGYLPEELTGRSIRDFYPPEEWPNRVMAMQNADSGTGHAVFESRLLRKDGSLFPALLDVTAVRDEAGALVSRVSIIHDLTAQKEAETALRESEHTIRTLLDSAGQAILAVNQESRIVLLNPMAARMFGYNADELWGEQLSLLLSEEIKNIHAAHDAGDFDTPEVRPMGKVMDLSGVRHDGTRFPIEVSLSYIETSGGKLAVAFVSDITERTQMEQAERLRAQEIDALAARLLTVQEEERRRVSRDLHDGICQQLASLSMEIGRVAAESLPDDTRRALTILQSRAIRAAETARHLAHELHPSILDDLGVMACLQGLCKEFSQQHGIAVRFRHRALPKSVPRETGSCLFRIAQQSLENIAQHASATWVIVGLRFVNGRLLLSIRDDGVGFDPASIRGRGSLGLVGMEERARLVNGKLIISSRLGRGTRIVIEVPLPAGTI